MKYFLDTEFNAFGGKLMSLGLVREDAKYIYLVGDLPRVIHPWVKDNVVPHLFPRGVFATKAPVREFHRHIADFLSGDGDPEIITDWPDDVRHFCECLTPQPGYMISIPGIKFDIRRVDAYPTKLQDAIQHNAYWDAAALRHYFMVPIGV